MSKKSRTKKLKRKQRLARKGSSPSSGMNVVSGPNKGWEAFISERQPDYDLDEYLDAEQDWDVDDELYDRVCDLSQLFDDPQELQSLLAGTHLELGDVCYVELSPSQDLPLMRYLMNELYHAYIEQTPVFDEMVERLGLVDALNQLDRMEIEFRYRAS